MTHREHQARGCASYAAVTSAFVVEPSPDYHGRTFDAQDGRCVVLDREAHGGQLWRVRRPDGRIQPMRPSTVAAALRRQ